MTTKQNVVHTTTEYTTEKIFPIQKANKDFLFTVCQQTTKIFKKGETLLTYKVTKKKQGEKIPKHTLTQARLRSRKLSSSLLPINEKASMYITIDSRGGN